MVLGKEGVGKTHILRRLQKVSYERNESTNGVDINKLLLRDKELTWFDFGGQEVFYPTHQVCAPANFHSFIALTIPSVLPDGAVRVPAGVPPQRHRLR